MATSASAADAPKLLSQGVRPLRSPHPVRQELPVQREHGAIALGIGHPLHVEFKVDGTDDSVAELLTDELSDGCAVDLNHLGQPVHKRVTQVNCRRRTVWRQLHREFNLAGQAKQPAERRGLLGPQRLLTEHGRGRPDHTAAQRIRNLNPSEASGTLGRESNNTRL
jgi:hypothetical protein